MLSKDAAHNIARRVAPDLVVVDDDGIRELQHGWLFPYRAKAEPVVGSNGVIVNKATGKIFTLGSAFPIERDLHFYDLGFQFECYDLVVLSVRDAEATLDALLQLGLATVEPTYESGTVWRIAREMTRAELRDRIARLPCVFGDTFLYFTLEVLEAARAADIFQFKVLECRGTKP